MSKPKIEFGIVKFKISNDRAVIDGRCHYGPIPKGIIFNALYTIKAQLTSEGYGPSIRGEIIPVELKLLSIHLYGHYMEELHEGMTARLELEGTGVDKIQEGMAIASVPQAPGPASFVAHP